MNARDPELQVLGTVGRSGIVTTAKDAAVRALLKPILHHLDRDGITELVINAAGFVLLETELGWQKIAEPDLTLERLNSLAIAIATYCQQEISPNKPILSAMLPAGERVQIVIAPAVPVGTISFSIRKPASGVRGMAEYQADGIFEDVLWKAAELDDESIKFCAAGTEKLLAHLNNRAYPEFFQEAVRQHLNICIVGDTGSGKTTFMKTLCCTLPKHERIITIEDVREIYMDHPNCVHLLYSKGGQGQSKVTPADLIASCMRMKPDRVLLAELRGSESYDFLKLLTTGHSGSITSYHAASCKEAIARFVLMAKEHPEAAAYQDTALKRLLFMTMDVIAHLKAVAVFDGEEQVGKKRRMTEIYFDPLKKSELAFET